MADEKTNKEVSEWDATLIKGEGTEKAEGEPRQNVPYLLLVQGPHQGQKFFLNPGDNTIGRTMGSEVLLEDQSVSRQHAIVTQSREGWTVEDRGSKNGTLVNGQRIAEKITIGHGDVIQVGIYSLRLITKEVSKEEMLKPPADWEGRTLMVGTSHVQDETATISEGEGSEKAVQDDGTQPRLMVPERELQIPEEIPEVPRKKRPLWWTVIMVFVMLLVVGGGGSYLYFKVIHKPKKQTVVTKPETEKPRIDLQPGTETTSQSGNGTAVTPQNGQTLPVNQPQTTLPTQIPVFLDFASSPLPATVTFEGQSYGTTPIKTQAKLDVDKAYTAEATFDLKEIGELYKEKVIFTVKREESLIPILFKGPIGILKVMELPRDVELYLEGYFVYDPFNAKTAKLENVVFGKPVYVPYGKYVVELRTPKELAGSGTFVNDIRYRREVLITEDNPVLALQVTEKDLTELPVEILSIPPEADVFVDAQKVGKTPYKGILPLGEHSLSLRKDGYFEYKQDLKMDINTPFKTEITLKTTVAGEFINVGKLLMQKGQYPEAINKLTEVFKQSPTTGETAEARYLLGSCFINTGDFVSAEDYFKQAMTDESMKYPAELGLVSVYNNKGKRNEAIPLLVDVLWNNKNEVVKKEALSLFQQISPLKSMMLISTDPTGAKVLINDKPIDQLTPIILPDLQLGNYRVHIEKDGYYPQDLSISMSLSEFNPVIVKLRPLPQ